SKDGIEFLVRDIRDPLDDLGLFDLVWVRFVLEYYRSEAFEIVKNLSKVVKPGGILCLIDLDHNCLNYFGLSERLEKTIHRIIETLMEKFNFDPFAGRKLYSYLFDLGYESIEVEVEAHHLIYGKISEVDAYNWKMKLCTVIKKVSFEFPEYENGCEGFLQEIMTFLDNPRRFIYTPVIMAKGFKPSSGSTL
ncbi:MAG: class I SAM-dependent methyltransferase, partial [Candidatus Jordarchaeaceae archaeon]